jgi:hypothetical protein
MTAKSPSATKRKRNVSDFTEPRVQRPIAREKSAGKKKFGQSEIINGHSKPSTPSSGRLRNPSIAKPSSAKITNEFSAPSPKNVKLKKNLKFED